MKPDENRELTVAEMRMLATAEFSAVLAADPEIKHLNSLKYNKTAETFLLLEVLGLGDIRLGKLPVRPLTAAKWAFLWMLENKHVTGGTASTLDDDIFLYVLSLDDLRKCTGGLTDIPAAASGYSKTCGVDANAEIKAMIATAFRPLLLLPPRKSSDDDEKHFDALWITGMCSRAACEANVTFERAMYDISLSTVTCLYVNWFIRDVAEPGKVRRRNSDEVSAMIADRTEFLGREFLRKKQNADSMQDHA